MPKISVECYAITHAGEGERGRKVEVLGSPHESAPWFAQEAADYFDGQEMHEQRIYDEDVGAFHGGSQVIEVADHPKEAGPVRFSVRCEVVRKYDATRID
jgi:hypothetical protein